MVKLVIVVVLGPRANKHRSLPWRQSMVGSVQTIQCLFCCGPGLMVFLMHWLALPRRVVAERRTEGASNSFVVCASAAAATPSEERKSYSRPAYFWHTKQV